MAKSATPTSAKTASHIVTNPPAPNSKTIAFITKARVIFCQRIRLVYLPILITIAILLGLSS